MVAARGGNVLSEESSSSKVCGTRSDRKRVDVLQSEYGKLGKRLNLRTSRVVISRLFSVPVWVGIGR